MFGRKCVSLSRSNLHSLNKQAYSTNLERILRTLVKYYNKILKLQSSVFFRAIYISTKGLEHMQHFGLETD